MFSPKGEWYQYFPTMCAHSKAPRLAVNFAKLPDSVQSDKLSSVLREAQPCASGFRIAGGLRQAYDFVVSDLIERRTSAAACAGRSRVGGS